MLEFKKISIEDKKIFDKYRSVDKTNYSESSFTTLFIWNEYYNLETAENGEFFFMRFNKKGKPAEYFYPIGNGNIEKAIYMLGECAKSRGEKLNFGLVSKENAQKLRIMLGDGFEFTPNRNCADYIYLSEKLISLSGRKLHSKKNHYNYFVENYDYTYTPVEDAELLNKCAQKAYKWVLAKEKNKNSFEIGAMRAYFENYDALGQKGAVITVDGEIVAMSFGERINDDCALIQIELADENYRGAYQAINKLFCENEWKDCTYINREEDMGIEGLRRAKESYMPVCLAEKYFVTQK